MSRIDCREPAWRDKEKIGALMKRLRDHAEGKNEMTVTQIRAAQIYLGKTVPDLARTEMTGKDGKDLIPAKVEIEFVHANKNPGSV